MRAHLFSRVGCLALGLLLASPVQARPYAKKPYVAKRERRQAVARVGGAILVSAGGVLGTIAVFPLLGVVFKALYEPGEAGMLEWEGAGFREDFLYSSFGLLAASALVVGGVIWNRQGHQSQTHRVARRKVFPRLRLRAQHQWNGRSHSWGLAGRF